MRSLVRRIRDYPALSAALVAAAVGGGLDLAGYHVWAQWGISAFAILVALLEGVAMVRSIVRGKWGIDVLAITAIVATVVVGEYWAALIIVIMFTGGEALETFAAGRAKRELTALLNRTPLIAHRLRGDEPEDVPVGQVELGDALIVRPGELVPVDGILESAAATLDESSLTGESLPVDRHAGDALFSGAVNGSSVLTMRVTARAEDSQYQRIVALVAEAAESKAPFVRMADRYAVPFTIAAYVFAAVGWIWNGEASRFAEVLVVATPCPLIIATPVAFIAGMSRQARNGVIVKNGGTLEKLARIRTAAFDKTGTLTHGQPALAGIHAQKGWHDDDLLAIVASAEQYSAHTLAQSIVTSTRFLGLPLSPATDVVETTAHGLTATVAKRSVVVGKLEFVRDVDASAKPAKLAPGEVGVYVAVDGAFAGAIILRDEVRPDARHTIEWLRRMGVRHTVMLTGDALATAQHVADQLGMTEVEADCLPLDKVRFVAALPDRPVMMVGDGVNDAPVLAAADVGVAMGARGSTAASESADVVIMKDDVSRVAHAVEVSKQTIAIASQSIWIGMVLSLGLMVVAVFGLLPAIVGATLQEVIDLLTILNALRALGGRATGVRFESRNGHEFAKQVVRE